MGRVIDGNAGPDLESGCKKGQLRPCGREDVSALVTEGTRGRSLFIWTVSEGNYGHTRKDPYQPGYTAREAG